MLTSEKIAIAAHLHVLLRRKTGRVTDTEWMAANMAYATEIIRFARAKALEDGHEDLALWAGRLEKAVVPPKPAARPAPVAAPVPAPVVKAPVLAWSNSQRQRLEEADAAEGAGSGFGHSLFGESGFLESTFGPPDPQRRRDPDAPRYVGGIR